MPILANRVERKILMERVRTDGVPRKILSFYRYLPISDPQALRDELYLTWLPLGILGRIYLAPEGINAQMAIPESNMDAFLQTLHSYDVLKDVFLNETKESSYAFFKLDIRARKKIVVDGLQNNVLESASPGNHLKPTEFHQMLDESDVIVVDARNGYECEIGHFENAIRPTSKTFAKVLPELIEKLRDHRDKKILMYCTGGIRCEKASAYLKNKGFNDVYQLQGGIVNYLNQFQEADDCKYRGSMYVFDERMAETRRNEKISRCQQCQAPHLIHSNCGHIHCHSLMIQCPGCAQKYDGCCSFECAAQKKKSTKT